MCLVAAWFQNTDTTPAVNDVAFKLEAALELLRREMILRTAGWRLGARPPQHFRPLASAAVPPSRQLDHTRDDTQALRMNLSSPGEDEALPHIQHLR